MNRIRLPRMETQIFRYAIIVLFALLGSGLSAAQYKSILYLKNGKTIEGRIEGSVIDDYIKIETSEGSILTFKTDEIAKFTKERLKDGGKPGVQLSEEVVAQYESEKKSPVAGLLLSGLLLPGGGHFYARRNAWGLGYLAVESGLVISAFTIGISKSSPVIVDSAGSTLTRSGPNAFFYIAIITAGVVHLVDMIHAYFSVEAYNRDLRRKLSLPESYSSNVRLKFYGMGVEGPLGTNLGLAPSTQYGLSFNVNF